MRTRSLTVASVALVAALAGCGGSKSQAQVRSCWNTQLATYAKQYAGQVGSGLPSNAGLNTTAEKLVFDTAAAYEAHNLTSGDTIPGSIPRFKGIEAKCGRLTVNK